MSHAHRKAEKRRGPRTAGKPAAAARTPVDGMLWGNDLGAEDALRKGLVEFSTSAVVPLEPDNPRSATSTQPQARRVWPPERLARMPKSTITTEGLSAAERFRNDWYFAEYGVRGGRDDSGIKVDSWSRLPYNEARAMCRQSCAMAASKIGARAWVIVRWCVLEVLPEGEQHATAEACAAYLKRQGRENWDIAKVVGGLSIALDILAAHYDGYGRSERATIAPGRKEGDGR